MNLPHLLLLVAAFLFELIATFGPATKINLVAAGLACYFATLLF